MFLRPLGGASAGEHLMLQFIPFEDDWDALERLRPEDLIPYRVGLLPEPEPGVLSAPASLPAAASPGHPGQGGRSGA